MSFPIEGNSGVRKAVLNCIETSRIPHAIIIDGDVGTGKHTLALYIAKAVVCGGENK
ncbi:MAG: hypothetical protein II802_03470, partial [Clostridia bacterium]|nr:hypothetical protein [Clostridia bacterium]